MAAPQLHFTKHPGNRVAARRIRRGQGKGRPPPRSCPDDFDIIFVEVGRLDCENWYRASRRTINRWLNERGKVRLINLRAAYIRHLRNQAAAAKLGPKRPEPLVIAQAFDQDLARLAAEFLRYSRNGGWAVSQTSSGLWRVGITVKTVAELLDMAVRKGFDVERANLQLAAERAVQRLAS